MSGLTRKIILRDGACALLGAVTLSQTAPAAAESRSSDGDADCSNGRCRRGYVRTERWRESRRDRDREDDRRRAAPWRGRGEDDDDDDD